jgi:ring-1,2-phenylacetyl-CoA epoxidase subunit PaaD
MVTALVQERPLQPTRQEALEAVLGPWALSARGAGAGATPASGTDAEHAWAAAATVCDPELPVLSVADLGVLRAVRVDDGAVTVDITPTYSGCPMMDVMARDVAAAVRAAGFADVAVHTVLHPAWTTEWLSADGRRKLEDFGIAPPTGIRPTEPVLGGLHVRCPHCRSLNTRETSWFSSTSCKALYECRACGEPFDYFKAH